MGLPAARYIASRAAPLALSSRRGDRLIRIDLSVRDPRTTSRIENPLVLNTANSSDDWALTPPPSASPWSGATRGAGRASPLHSRGRATVICTGRTSTTGTLRSTTTGRDDRRDAQLVTDLVASATRSRLTISTRRSSALATRISDEHGHIDVLVNDIWGAELLKGGPTDWNIRSGSSTRRRASHPPAAIDTH